MTPLAARLIALIRANGPMTVADYMAACLGDPVHGYYRHAEPFGKDGDFVTAPEVSQMFGELIGVWAVATWQAMGAPAPFVLAELGPGRGTLMADMLRAARVRPAFIDAARVHLVETSPRLREIQRTTLGATPATWHDAIAALPAGPTILIANEFFDALPIHQYVRTAEGSAERMVGLGDDGGLAFGLRPAAGPSTSLPSSSYGEAKPRPEDPFGKYVSPSTKVDAPETGPPVKPEDDVGIVGRAIGTPGRPEGAVRESSPAATAIISAVAERLAHHIGAALIIDYGYAGPAFVDTLQAVRKHRYDEPLAAPGEADLTAHVDFTALARAATNAGAEPRPLITQGEFLGRLGLAARVAILSRGKDAATAAAIVAAAERLAGPTAMGELFKVLAVASAGLALPAFDEHVP